ncbi:MAG: hypothetical protein ABJA86_12515 [Nocardioidaceae bacterium]
MSRKPGGPRQIGERTDTASTVDEERLDVITVLIGLLIGGMLIATAMVVPHLIDVGVGARFPPLNALWMPRWGPGTLPAVVIALLAVAAGPGLVLRLGWRPLLAATWLVSTGWTMALATVDGPDGITHVFASRYESLVQAATVGDVHQMLGDFVSRIPSGAPDPWATHVAGHPAGNLLLFVVMTRVGLDTPLLVGLAAIIVGSSASAAALVLVRALATESLARRAAPFLIIAPTALWIGVSADAFYLAVTTWGLAVLALACAAFREPANVGRARALAIVAGLLLGFGVYLSYGLVLMGIAAVAVLLAARTVAPLGWAALGAAGVMAAFTLAGFSWWDAFPVLIERYHSGQAQDRPYWYWVWANLAAWTCSAGLSVWVAIAQLVRNRGYWSATATRAVALVSGSALLMMGVATMSGLSKSECERIWLPFTVLVLPLFALCPRRDARWLLGLQALAALVLQHLLLTTW